MVDFVSGFLFFDWKRLKFLEMVKPKRTPPFVHDFLVEGIKLFSFMYSEFIKLSEKICPPVSISKPIPSGL